MLETWVVEIAVGLIVIPWVGWVSASIFNQRQELAVLKNSYELNTKLYDLLDKRLK